MAKIRRISKRVEQKSEVKKPPSIASCRSAMRDMLDCPGVTRREKQIYKAVIALLEGDEGEALVDWLGEHTK